MANGRARRAGRLVEVDDTLLRSDENCDGDASFVTDAHANPWSTSPHTASALPATATAAWRHCQPAACARASTRPTLAGWIAS